MLKLKPNCEVCNKDLPPHATDALICSYECTFCSRCVEEVLTNVCPNCGGGFSPRPIRPQKEYRAGVSLKQHPASTERVTSPYSEEQIKTFSAKYKAISAAER